MLPNLTISEIIKKRILVLDGAMGTMIQKFNLKESDFRGDMFTEHTHNLKGMNDVLCLTKPDVIADIHNQYLEAGADIIETNTFNATSVVLSDYGLSDFAYDINFAAAKIAKETADKYTLLNPNKPRFVAGSIGPTSKTLSIATDVDNTAYREIDFNNLSLAYQQQINALVDAGVDLLLIETIFDTLNAKAAIYAAKNVFAAKNIELPILLSVTLSGKGGRTLSGQSIDAFITSVKHANALAIGFNCSFGAAEMMPFVEELANKSSDYLIVYPNAGLPDGSGCYTQSPNEMSKIIKSFLEKSIVNIIGGCCGTTPEHIKQIAESLNDFNPFTPKLPNTNTKLSGLEILDIKKENNFILIGERTNVAGSKRFARLINEKKYDEAVEIARHQVDSGANIIDINMDDAMLDAKAEMITFLNILASEPDTSKVPFMLDSSKFDVLTEGLKCIQGKAVINSISLKEGEKIFIEKALEINKLGAAIIVMAFDEKGQAADFKRKIEICKRSYDLLVAAGFPPQDIIFDPNILTIGTGLKEHSNYAVDYLNSVKWIKDNLPYAKVSGGISNLSYAFRGNNLIREALHSIFLYHAIKAGLDMAIVNAGSLPLYDSIPCELKKLCEDLIFNKNDNAADLIVNYALQHNDSISDFDNSISKDIIITAEERLFNALINGNDSSINSDIDELLKDNKTPLQIIDEILMKSMNEVGEMFGNGKMFLPQVLRSARIMKKAVAKLEPLLKNNDSDKSEKKRILLATVKGDVHDIGKNILSVILSCNNFEVIDAGVMVPANDIIKKAIDFDVDVIGLSGLITPSLDEMINVAKEMENNSLQIPLMIGGATTSAVHTAAKIAPAYSGKVFHVKDASQAPKIINDVLSYNHLIKLPTYKKNNVDNKKYVSLEQARNNSFISDFSKICKPKFIGIKYINESIDNLVNWIDWTAFLRAYRINGRYPEILNHDNKGKEAKRIIAEAKKMLVFISEQNILKPSGVFGIFSAKSFNDDVFIYKDDDCLELLAKLYFLRNQELKLNDKKNVCLSDFVSTNNDYIGLFALTTGESDKEILENHTFINDDYSNIMFKILCDRIVEAFSAKLHYDIRTQYWAYEENNNLEFLDDNFKGIRPAPGYPCCPEHSEKTTIFNILNAEKAGIKLTETYGMIPSSSVCGYYFANADAHYFSTGNFNNDQIIDYANRKNIVVSEVEKLLFNRLNY